MYDLSPQFFSYLSPNLILQVLTVLQSKNVYPTEFIVKQQYKILSSTAQFEKTQALVTAHPTLLPQQDVEAIQKLQAEFAKKMTDIRSQLGDALSQLVDDTAALSTRDLLSVKRENITELRVTVPQLSALVQYAAALVHSGKYLLGAIAYYLYFLTCEGIASGPNSLNKDVVWHMIEAALLSQCHHGAFFDTFFKKMREIIDVSTSLTIAQQTHQRVTYLIWVLFAFTTDPPQNALVQFHLVWSDMIYSQQSSTAPANSSASMQMNNERLLNALLFQIPSLLRYIVLSTLISAKVPASQTQPWFLKRSPFFKELTRVLTIQYGADNIEQKDPIIKFFQQVFVEFNISAAVQTLNTEIPALFAQDPFLFHIPLQVEVYDACKAVLVDMTMKLHTKLTLQKLQQLLPITVKLDGFDPTISLGGTPAAKDTPAAAAPTAEASATDGAPAAQPEETTEVVVAPQEAGVFTSPLLLKHNYHQNLIKRLKNNNTAKR